jgi:protein-tyrosine-phosphatase
MAMVLLKELVRENGCNLELWDIASAGCHAYPGFPATATAQFVMHESGLNLSHHRSQLVTRQLLHAYALVLCMEKDHKSFIQRAYPMAANRIYLLSEMAGHENDINDPVGQPSFEYQKTADLMQAYMVDGFDKICALSTVERLLNN